MKIRNETGYDTRAIRRIITATHNRMARFEGRVPQWRHVTFEVACARGNRCTGWAWLRGTRSRLRLPSERVTVRRLVNLTWHEILHLHGYEHGQMMNGGYPNTESMNAIARAAKFAPGDVIPTAAPAPPRAGPTPREKAEADLRKALEKRKEWTAKAKRARTALARWRERELRARRKLEEAGGDPAKVRAEALGSYEPAMPGDIKVR